MIALMTAADSVNGYKTANNNRNVNGYQSVNDNQVNKGYQSVNGYRSVATRLAKTTSWADYQKARGYQSNNDYHCVNGYQRANDQHLCNVKIFSRMPSNDWMTLQPSKYLVIS